MGCWEVLQCYQQCVQQEPKLFKTVQTKTILGQAQMFQHIVCARNCQH